LRNQYSIVLTEDQFLHKFNDFFQIQGKLRLRKPFPPKIHVDWDLRTSQLHTGKRQNPLRNSTIKAVILQNMKKFKINFEKNP
jgi:hypothetical protein